MGSIAGLSRKGVKMLQEEKEKLSFEETDRIIIPSKYRCEKHSYYSDEKPCHDCMKAMSVGINDLHNKSNLPLAAFIDENKVMQIVINTDDECMLWATWKRMENAINFVLQQKEMKRQATSIQTVSAGTLDKLRGIDA